MTPGSVIRTLCALVLFSSLLPHAAAATKQVFNTFKDRLLQVRIIDTSTSAKSTIGSGFFINGHGLIVTNYHVVAKHVFKPEQYRIEYVGNDNKPRPAHLVNLDVIHDLALLQTDQTDTAALSLKPAELSKGERIYTLGNPLDLGMTIVEGTYNGITDDTMHERILLSSALNPGMSGGPSITDDGKVVGINVATAGNNIGFLVPAHYLRDLIAQPADADTDFMKLIRKQLLANQDRYIGAILSHKLKRKRMGDYLMPDKLTDYLSCWGDSDDEIGPYRESEKHCATKNDIYLNRFFSTGEIAFAHYHLQAEDINELRFYHILQNYFAHPPLRLSGTEDYFTEFECKNRIVEHGRMRFKVAFCLRSYTDFAGLYDMVLNAATLTEPKTAVQTTLVLTGVSYDNAVAFAKTYLESFEWIP
jgi:hypothetical protein